MSKCGLRQRALRCGDRIYLNLVSSYLCDYTCDRFLALFTKLSDRIPDSTPGDSHAT
ncbi:MAG: hypothetical protein PUP90_01855 [Nostoc sp. S4]|nr:hypothetical protein [Nostoc sp. S4]